MSFDKAGIDKYIEQLNDALGEDIVNQMRGVKTQAVPAPSNEIQIKTEYSLIEYNGNTYMVNNEDLSEFNRLVRTGAEITSKLFPIVKNQIKDNETWTLQQSFVAIHVENTSSEVIIRRNEKPPIYANISSVQFKQSLNNSPDIIVDEYEVSSEEEQKIVYVIYSDSLFFE